MNTEKMHGNEAEYAGFVDQGTRAVLQEAVAKIVENFSQTDALEDMISYLEEIRDSIKKSDERIKEVQQKEKQINDKMTMVETSVRNLLQRIQEMEVQVAKSVDVIDEFSGNLIKLTEFFEQPPLKRMFGRLEPAIEEIEFEESSDENKS